MIYRDLVNLIMPVRGFLGIFLLIRILLQKTNVTDTPAIPNTPAILDTLDTEPSTQPGPNSRTADDSCKVVCTRNKSKVFTFKYAIPVLLYGFQSLSRQLQVIFPHYSCRRFKSLDVECLKNSVINHLYRLKVIRNSLTLCLASKILALPGNGLTGSRHQGVIVNAIVKRISRLVPPSSKKVGSLGGHTNDTYKVELSPCRRFCAITCRCSVKIYKIESGRFVCLHTLQHDKVVDVKFHPKFPEFPYIVVCAGTATIYRMDDETFKVVATMKAKRFHTARVRIPEGDFFSASFDPTGRFIVLGCDNWRIYWYSFTDEDCTELQRLDRTHESQITGHNDTVTTILYHLSGKFFVSGSDDRTVKVWQQKTSTDLWTCIQTIEGHTNYVNAVTIDPTGRYLLSASSDNTARVYEIGTWECLQTIQTDHINGISSCVFYPSEEEDIILVTGSYGGKVIIHRLSNDGTTTEVLETHNHDRGVYSLAINQITRLLVVGFCCNYSDRHERTVIFYELPQ